MTTICAIFHTYIYCRVCSVTADETCPSCAGQFL